MKQPVLDSERVAAPTSAAQLPGEVNRGALAAVLALAIGFPSLITWLYFIVFAGDSLVQLVYSVGKVLQFAIPVAWVWGIERRGRDGETASQVVAVTAQTRRSSALVGVGLGAIIVAALFGLYAGYFRSHPVMADMPEIVRGKLADAGITTPLGFLALATFYSLVHSALEEYYWRWFVFGRLRALVPVVAAIVISSLGFMAHHTLVVGIYFDGLSAMTVLLSAAVAIGGAIWAWLYQRTGSLLGAWICHVMVDVGIMAVGYDLVFRMAS
ncbi:MAG: CPBP family intramembrane glutamic endopeptidase [Pirellulales bacterium]